MVHCSFRNGRGDAAHLWAALSGKKDSDYGISHTLSRQLEMVRRQCHRTLSLVEHYVVGTDGSLLVRRTHHTIRAIEDGVDIYLFNHEPQASRIEVQHGGSVGRKYE